MNGFMLLLTLAAFVLQVNSAQDPIVGPGFDKLDLSAFTENIDRAGRQQFKAVGGGGGGGGGEGEEVVGVGLIDALQRWADALEAQITLMRQEMSDMRADNRRLREEAARASTEAEAAKRELKDVRSSVKANQGEMVRLSGGADAKVESLRGDLRTFSESFSDFLGHYDKTMRQVRGNHSTVQSQLDWTKKSVKDLSSTLGDHNVDGLRHSLDELGDRVTVLAQADYILEERVRQSENRTDVFAETLNKELLVLRNSIVSPAAFRQALANLSMEVESVRSGVGVNVTAVTFSVKALEQTMKTSFDDVTRLLSAAEDRTDRLTKDVQVQAKAFAEDFMNFQKSIDFAKNKYDELAGVTEGLKVRLREHSTLRQNLTSAMLKAMNELGGRIGETDSRLETLRPDMEQLNESLNTFIGQVGAEVIKLHTMDEELNIRLEDLETVVVGGSSNGGDFIASRNKNSSSGGAESTSLSSRIKSLEHKLAQIRGNDLPILLASAAESRSNHSRVLSGVRGLEKHFVDLKREGFERGLAMVSLNDTTRELGEAARELAQATEALAENTAQIDRRVAVLQGDAEELAAGLEQAQRERDELRGEGEQLEEALVREAGKNDDRLRALAAALTRQDDGQRNVTVALSGELATLANHTAELTANFSRMLVFAAANKAEILELKVVGNTLEDKLDRLYDLQQTHQVQTQEAGDHTVGNLTRLRGAAASLERDIDAMTDRFQTLEQLVSDHLVSTGELKESLQELRAGQGEQGETLQTVRLELETAREERESAEVMAAEVRGRVDVLAANMTEVAANLTRHEGLIEGLREAAVAAEDERAEIDGRVDANMRGLQLADEQLQVLRTNGTTLKANIVGLGNYINNINSDVGKLASTFEKYIAELKEDMEDLRGNTTSVEVSLEESISGLSANLSAQEAAVKGEIAGLTTKAFTMKTSLSELREELSVVKADDSNLLTKVGALEARLSSATATRESQIKELAAVRSDVSALRTGLTGLTNSMFNLKQQSQQAEAKGLEARVERVADDLTAVGREVSRLRRDFVDTGEELQTVSAEMLTFRNSVSQMSAKMSSVSDPPRFSCAVTSDEIRTSGVITYNICNVNTEGLMDRETGHVTIKQAGDYFVSFTGNMVSSNAQAVWCALYKQSAGNDGWQVLGMINNYQRNGENLDDRDSGSLSTITSLQEGDQIWVEWRGYGDSFLYSNPYRLISFTGFLLKPTAA